MEPKLFETGAQIVLEGKQDENELGLVACAQCSGRLGEANRVPSEIVHCEVATKEYVACSASGKRVNALSE